MRSLCLGIVLLAMGAAVPARAGAPVLELDAGLPLSDIHALQADAAGRSLALAGREPVVRLLDALTGAPLAALRLPQEEGAPPPELTALALALGGEVVAAATYAAVPGEAVGRAELLLLDRRGGALRRLSLGRWASERVRGLALSPEGDRLAAAHGAAGLAVFDVRRGALLGRDEDYAAPCTHVEAGPGGALLTASADGALRRYDAALRPVRRSEGRPPLSLRLSPDGRRLAASFREEPRLELLSALDLSQVHRPDTASLPPGDVTALAWSRTGALLYAAGPRGGAIRRFGGGGAGASQDLPAAGAPITALAALPNDGVAFAAGPSVGALSAAGKRLFLRGRAPLPDGAAVVLDRGGTRVRFALPTVGGAPRLATFALRDHSLRVEDKGRPDPTAPVPGLEIAGAGVEVRWAGAALALPPGERALCAAAAPDQKGLLLGTDRSLLRYEPDGQLRYRTPLPAPAQALAVSGDGRLAVAQLGSGVLSWHDVKDGRPLLSLFADTDGRRWVAFTPSGYYDASAGGEDLIGWQVHRRGDGPADFFRAGLFQKRFYRPELVVRALVGLDEARAIEESEAAGGGARQPPLQRLLPPVVRVLDPADQAAVDGDRVQLRLAVRSTSGEPVTAVRVQVNGVRTATRGLVVEKMGQAGAQAGEVEKRISVPLPGEDATLAVIAETGFARSEAAVVRLRRRGGGTLAPEGKPDLNVLSIGVSRYRDASLQLGYPAKDAQDLSAAFAGQQGKRYGTVRTRVLTDGQASRAAVLEGLLWLRQQTRPGDLSVLFLAGHGLGSAEDGKYYFLPYDADPASPEETMVDAAQLQATLASIPGRVLLFLDTCHSGSVLGPRDRSARDLLRLVSEMASVESGVVVYAASTGGQQSREAQKWGNGAFTKALVEGLKGKADLSQTGRVTVSSLEHYVSERVRELTLQAQTPTTAKPSTTPDFLLASVPVPLKLHRKWYTWAGAGAVALGLASGLVLGLRPWETPRPVLDFSK